MVLKNRMTDRRNLELAKGIATDTTVTKYISTTVHAK